MSSQDDCRRVEELVKLAARCCLPQEDNIEVGLSDLCDGCTRSLKISAAFINKGLFLENLPVVRRISRDCWRIYSYIHKRKPQSVDDGSISSHLDECLINLVKSQPMKSYLRLSFKQFLSFILGRNEKNNYQEDASYLLSYINEVRASFTTICHQDRQMIRPKIKLSTAGGNFVQQISGNAPFLLNWSSIEAAKYCICNKFAPETSANDFLDLLQRETLSIRATGGDKLIKYSLINFIQNIDKFIQDRILESSTGKHTFNCASNIEQFYQANNSIFQTWLSKNRQNIAKISLFIDNPAECWRNTNLKLYSDLETRFHGFSQTDKDPSFSQTLMSLNTKNWYSNLGLIALSAKQLNDLPLLHGLRTLIDLRGIICEYPPLKAIISNLEGCYEKTFDSLKNEKDLNEQSTVELLDSCIELDILEENSEYIERLKSNTMRSLYNQYLESRNYENEVPKSRLEQVKCWLNTWSSELDSSDTKMFETQPTRSYIDLIVPTCLNIISRAPEGVERVDLMKRTEWLVGHDFIAQCLFPPNFINNNIKVYHTILDLLKNGKISKDLVELHSEDLHFNHLLYRHICGMNLTDKLREQNGIIDLIQFRAAQYNQRHNNTLRALKISEDLSKNALSEEIKLKSSILMIKDDALAHDKHSSFHDIALQIKSSTMEENSKRDLILKVLRRILGSSVSHETSEIHLYNLVGKDYLLDNDEDKDDTEFTRWQNLLGSSSLSTKIKTLNLFSKLSNEQLLKTLTPNNVKLLNSTFELDLKLLEELCKSDLAKHKSTAIECVSRILKQIVTNHDRLSGTNLDRFSSESFINATTNTWILVKSNLLSLICHQELSADWRIALISVVKQMGQVYPNHLIYSIIVNRLDLQSELVCLTNDTATTSLGLSQEPCTILLQNDPLGRSTIQEPCRLVRDCQRRLTFWNELFDHIKSNDKFDNKWLDIVMETERFLKEIRKISFLPGEYLTSLTIRIPKRLFNFLDYFSKVCDTSPAGAPVSRQRLEECENRLKTICHQAINPIRVLLSYGDKIGTSHMTTYDIWFCEKFHKLLRELEYRINLLAKKKPLILLDVSKLITSITELLAVCRSTLWEYNHNNRHKLFMELISPMLSRLEPSIIPMPDCCNEQSLQSTKPIVTIHKISQTVNLIASKTCPKKLKFIGSDGISRSFLLKAHEDLRLDQLIMELFASIDHLFMGNKESRNKFRLRRFSVTPVSSRSGLIEWIEAQSLYSSYRAWLSGPNGRKLTGRLYESTCDALCDQNRSAAKTNHLHCQPPQNVQTVDLFYQLLWAKTKPTKQPISAVKPSFSNIVKYRAHFDPSIFQSTIEHLVGIMPNEIIANELWYKSVNSHAYWMRKQKFIDSCAAISIVGYIIGLGDRHPENILLDHNTGEVIHIDYNICFELGKTLPIPEQVPFRLTQNVIRAFGFAGLEGGFTLSCRAVLNTLKASKSTLLHLLDPVNLSFMIGEPSKFEDTVGVAKELVEVKQVPPADAVATDYLGMQEQTQPRQVRLIKYAPHEQMDMCSQESVELNPSAEKAPDLSELLILNHTSMSSNLAKQHPSVLAPNEDSVRATMVGRHHQQVMPTGSNIAATRSSDVVQVVPPSIDLQHNIKTPTKILAKTAASIHDRIRDKLSGSDECVRHYKNKQERNSRILDISGDGSQSWSSQSEQAEQSIDLIILNDAQTTEDQVDALIIEATSIKNQAAMFEGWVPWV